MAEILSGLGLAVVGLVLCFAGQRLVRIALALGGAALGFPSGLALHAALVGRLPGGTVTTVPPWVLGVALAAIFAWGGYAFYSAAVLLLLGSIGWSIGLLVVSSFEVPPGSEAWIEIACALALALLGLFFDVPRWLMIVLTAVTGGIVVVAAAQVLLHQPVVWLNSLTWGADVSPHLVWLGALAGVAIAGIVVQSRQHGRDTLRRSYQD